jgi:hypothetical protein
MIEKRKMAQLLFRKAYASQERTIVYRPDI